MRSSRKFAETGLANPVRRSLLLGSAAAWLTSTGAATQVDIDVSLIVRPAGQGNRPARVLDSRFAGLSFEKSILSTGFLSPENRDLIALLRSLGPGQMRIGANAVDLATWSDAPGPGTARAITREQIAALGGLLQAVNWRVLYGINLASNTPEHAATEARAATDCLGPSLLAFEFGNEVDLYRYNGHRPASYRYPDFLAEWRQMANVVRREVPDAPLSGPASSFDIENYTEPFARDCGRDIVLLTQHYYRADARADTSTLDLLLSDDDGLSPALERLARAGHAIVGGTRIAEANSLFHEGRTGVSDAPAAALWTLKLLCLAAAAGTSGVDLHGGGADKAYTPLVANGPHVDAVRPGFLALMLFNRAARGVMRAIDVVPALSGVTAFAVDRTNDGPAVIVINSRADAALDITLHMDSIAGEARRFDLVTRDANGMSVARLSAASAIEPGQAWPRGARVDAHTNGRLGFRLGVRSASVIELDHV